MSLPATEAVILPADESHVPVIFQFIRQLAEFEKLSSEMTATEHNLRHFLFGPDPAAEALLAYLDGKPAGFALFFRTFSTFAGHPGLYLEDLFVDPALRGRGIGRALLTHLARLTVERGYQRLEWAVLDWNEPAIRFYRSLGASPLDDWTSNRLTGEPLRRLAGAAG